MMSGGLPGFVGNAISQVVPLTPPRQKALMIAPQKFFFQTRPPLRIPVERHHKREVARPRVWVPQLPVYEDGSPRVPFARVEEVPRVRVAVRQRKALASAQPLPRRGEARHNLFV